MTVVCSRSVPVAVQVNVRFPHSEGVFNKKSKNADISHIRLNGVSYMGYSTDLTDKQWSMIEAIFKSNKGQHLVEHSKRDLVNAVLYLVKTGCQWRLLPNDFPPHNTVWSFYRRAVKSGKWEKAMDILVKKTV